MPDLRLTPERWEQLRRLAEAVEYCVDHGTAPALTQEAILATCAFREIERLRAEVERLRAALQSLRRRIDDIIQAATKKHRDLYWLDDGVTQMVKADADAALAASGQEREGESG